MFKMGEFSTGKSVIVLVTVVGCFAILWPRIFYPMMQAALSLTSASQQDEDRLPRQPPNMHLPPRMREAMAESRPDFQREGRPFPHPSSRQPPKPQPKTGGAMSIVMPIYTVGIVGFFLYTILKLMFRKPAAEQNATSIYQNLNMDPNHRLEYELNKKRESLTSKNQKKNIANEQNKTKKFLQDFGKHKEDFEILKLREKLIETEERMEKILSQIGNQLNHTDAKHQRLILKNLQQLSQMQDAQLVMEAARQKKSQDNDETQQEEINKVIDENPRIEILENASNNEKVAAEEELIDSDDDLSDDQDTSQSEEEEEEENSDENFKDLEDETMGELRQRVKNLTRSDEDFSYRNNRSCSYSDVLNF